MRKLKLAVNQLSPKFNHKSSNSHNFFLFKPSSTNVIFLNFLRKSGYLHGFLIKSCVKGNIIKNSKFAFLKKNFFYFSYLKNSLQFFSIFSFFMNTNKYKFYFFYFLSLSSIFFFYLFFFFLKKIKHYCKIYKFTNVQHKFLENKNDFFGICFLKHFKSNSVFKSITPFAKIPYRNFSFYELKKLVFFSEDYLVYNSKGLLNFTEALNFKVGGFILFKIK